MSNTADYLGFIMKNNYFQKFFSSLLFPGLLFFLITASSSALYAQSESEPDTESGNHISFTLNDSVYSLRIVEDNLPPEQEKCEDNLPRTCRLICSGRTRNRESCTDLCEMSGFQFCEEQTCPIPGPVIQITSSVQPNTQKEIVENSTVKAVTKTEKLILPEVNSAFEDVCGEENVEQTIHKTYLHPHTFIEITVSASSGEDFWSATAYPNLYIIEPGPALKLRHLWSGYLSFEESMGLCSKTEYVEYRLSAPGKLEVSVTTETSWFKDNEENVDSEIVENVRKECNISPPKKVIDALVELD